MRSLATEGIVAVAPNYRLAGAKQSQTESDDFAAAFRWARAHSRDFGADPDMIVAGGTSAGADKALGFASSTRYADDQSHVRGLVVANNGFVPTYVVPVVATLSINGTEGLDNETGPDETVLTAYWQRNGVDASIVIVPDRDHLTLIAYAARQGDPTRTAILHFMRSRLAG